MTKPQVQLFLVVTLGLVWGALWIFQHMPTAGSTPPTTALAPAQPIPAPPQTTVPPPPIDEAKHSDEGELLDSRDPFQLPNALQEIIQKRREREEEEKQARLRQERQEREQQARAGQESSAAAVTPPSLQLQGILLGGARPQVIINRQILSVGDKIEGVTVTSVTKEGAMISFEGREFQLKLPALEQEPSHAKRTSGRSPGLMEPARP